MLSQCGRKTMSEIGHRQNESPPLPSNPPPTYTLWRKSRGNVSSVSVHVAFSTYSRVPNEYLQYDNELYYIFTFDLILRIFLYLKLSSSQNFCYV